ncbi:MAG: beta strand repeat-containing protein [Candidatus Acidiferrales bacterium]
MPRKAQLFFLAVIIPALCSLAACGGGGTGTATIKSVTISPTAATVPVNTTTQFTAVVNLTDSTTTTNTAVTWQVNGVAGGSATTGTIAPSTIDVQVGIYTAPAVAPGGTDNGQVDITAVATQTTTSTTTTPVLITSNTAVVTVGAGEGLAVSPLTTTVPAGGSRLFAATLNSVADPNATWSIAPSNGDTTTDIGFIDPTSGLYTAPFFPPSGATITVTAKDGTATATATATIVFSDASLKGPFAFSYSGDNSSGFFAAAGSFVADGSGAIVSGVEDADSFSTGVSMPLAISGNYVVGPDGRGTITLNSGQQSVGTLQFALTTNQHANVIRFDRNVTGSGAIDQQNLNALTISPSVIAGPYAFSISGADSNFNPMGLVGRFSANGTGAIPTSGTTAILDAKINGVANTEDTSLTGNYAFDATRSGTGRGTITLTSNTTHSLQYAFYIVDSSHLLLVEIDRNAFLAGDMFGAPTGNSFSVAELSAGNYPFTNGGTAISTGATPGPVAYATGGIFTSDGGGNITGGTADSNIGGTNQSGSALGSCPYTVHNATGRIDLKLFTGSGACPGGESASVAEFAMYQTSSGSAVMLELDSAATANGVAYVQQITPGPVSGIFVLNLAGQGVFHNTTASFQPDVNGQLTLAGTAISGGNLDINTYSSVFQSDPLDPINSTIAAPDATLGRGTAKILGTNPAVTYNLAYYLVDANRALLFGTDTVRTMTGIVNRQSPPPSSN